jgi:hypothetical protein
METTFHFSRSLEPAQAIFAKSHHQNHTFLPLVISTRPTLSAHSQLISFYLIYQTRLNQTLLPKLSRYFATMIQP